MVLVKQLEHLFLHIHRVRFTTWTALVVLLEMLWLPGNGLLWRQLQVWMLSAAAWRHVVASGGTCTCECVTQQVAGPVGKRARIYDVREAISKDRSRLRGSPVSLYGAPMHDAHMHFSDSNFKFC